MPRSDLGLFYTVEFTQEVGAADSVPDILIFPLGVTAVMYYSPGGNRDLKYTAENLLGTVDVHCHNVMGCCHRWFGYVICDR